MIENIAEEVESPFTVKNDLSCKILSASELFVGVDAASRTEFMFLEICYNADKFLLGVLYNPPREDCAEKLEQKLFEHSLRYQNIV